jgi:hypothetical protein
MLRTGDNNMKKIETEIKVVATEALAKDVELSLAKEEEINLEEAEKRIEANTMVQPDDISPRSD